MKNSSDAGKSLRFSIAGVHVRPFMSALSCAAKIGDSVFIIARSSGLQISTSQRLLSAHLLVTVDRACLDEYMYSNAALDAAAATVGAREESDRLPDAPRGGYKGQDEANPAGGNTDLYMCFITRTLTATVLHQSTSCLQEIQVTYNVRGGKDGDRDDDNVPSNTLNNRRDAGGEQSSVVTSLAHAHGEHDNTDTVTWKYLYNNGIVKRFVVRLAAESAPARVYVDASAYHFEACGGIQVVGGLLASLPHSASTCAIYSLESRLEFRCTESSLDWALQSGAVAAAAAAAGGGVSGGSVGGSRHVSSATVASAYPRHFYYFRCFTHAAAAHTEMENDAADEAGWHVVPFSSVSLPGKLVGVKPLKHVVHLAGQLGHVVTIRVGSERTPVEVRSETIAQAMDEAGRARGVEVAQDQGRQQQQQKHMDSGAISATAFTVSSTASMPEAVNPNAYAAPQTAPFNWYASNGNAKAIGGLPVADSSQYISFVLYVAAMDIQLRNEVPHTTRSSTNTAATTTRTAGKDQAAPAVVPVREGVAVVDVKVGAATTQEVAASQLIASNGDIVPTLRMGSVGSNSMVYPTARDSGLSMVCASASLCSAVAPSMNPVLTRGSTHVDASCASSVPQSSASPFTSGFTAAAAKAGAAEQQEKPSLPSEEGTMPTTALSCAPSHFAPPSHNTPSWAVKDESNREFARDLFSDMVAAAAGDVSLPPPPPPSEMNFHAGSGNGTAAAGGRPSTLAALYPLDFETFAASSEMYAGEEASEEDEELERFLESCTALFMNGTSS